MTYVTLHDLKEQNIVTWLGRSIHISPYPGRVVQTGVTVFAALGNSN